MGPSGAKHELRWVIGRHHRFRLLSLLVGLLLLAGTSVVTSQDTQVATESQNSLEGLDGLIEDSLVDIPAPGDSVEDEGSNGGTDIRDISATVTASPLTLEERLSNAALVVEGTVVLGPGVLVQPCTEAAAIVPRPPVGSQQASASSDVIGVEIRGHFKGPAGFAPVDSDVAGGSLLRMAIKVSDGCAEEITQIGRSWIFFLQPLSIEQGGSNCSWLASLGCEAENAVRPSASVRAALVEAGATYSSNFVYDYDTGAVRVLEPVEGQPYNQGLPVMRPAPSTDQDLAQKALEDILNRAQPPAPESPAPPGTKVIETVNPGSITSEIKRIPQYGFGTAIGIFAIGIISACIYIRYSQLKRAREEREAAVEAEEIAFQAEMEEARRREEAMRDPLDRELDAVIENINDIEQARNSNESSSPSDNQNGGDDAATRTVANSGAAAAATAAQSRNTRTKSLRSMSWQAFSMQFAQMKLAGNWGTGASRSADATGSDSQASGSNSNGAEASASTGSADRGADLTAPSEEHQASVDATPLQPGSSASASPSHHSPALTTIEEAVQDSAQRKGKEAVVIGASSPMSDASSSSSPWRISVGAHEAALQEQAALHSNQTHGSPAAPELLAEAAIMQPQPSMSPEMQAPTQLREQRDMLMRSMSAKMQEMDRALKLQQQNMMGQGQQQPHPMAGQQMQSAPGAAWSSQVQNGQQDGQPRAIASSQAWNSPQGNFYYQQQQQWMHNNQQLMGTPAGVPSQSQPVQHQAQPQASQQQQQQPPSQNTQQQQPGQTQQQKQQQQLQSAQVLEQQQQQQQQQQSHPAQALQPQQYQAMQPQQQQQYQPWQSSAPQQIQPSGSKSKLQKSTSAERKGQKPGTAEKRLSWKEQQRRYKKQIQEQNKQQEALVQKQKQLQDAAMVLQMQVIQQQLYQKQTAMLENQQQQQHVQQQHSVLDVKQHEQRRQDQRQQDPQNASWQHGRMHPFQGDRSGQNRAVVAPATVSMSADAYPTMPQLGYNPWSPMVPSAAPGVEQSGNHHGANLATFAGGVNSQSPGTVEMTSRGNSANGPILHGSVTDHQHAAEPFGTSGGMAAATASETLAGRVSMSSEDGAEAGQAGAKSLIKPSDGSLSSLWPFANMRWRKSVESSDADGGRGGRSPLAVSPDSRKSAEEIMKEANPSLPSCHEIEEDLAAAEPPSSPTHTFPHQLPMNYNMVPLSSHSRTPSVTSLSSTMSGTVTPGEGFPLSETGSDRGARTSSVFMPQQSAPHAVQPSQMSAMPHAAMGKDVTSLFADSSPTLPGAETADGLPSSNIAQPLSTSLLAMQQLQTGHFNGQLMHSPTGAPSYPGFPGAVSVHQSQPQAGTMSPEQASGMYAQLLKNMSVAAPKSQLPPKKSSWKSKLSISKKSINKASAKKSPRNKAKLLSQPEPQLTPQQWFEQQQLEYSLLQQQSGKSPGIDAAGQPLTMPVTGSAADSTTMPQQATTWNSIDMGILPSMAASGQALHQQQPQSQQQFGQGSWDGRMMPPTMQSQPAAAAAVTWQEQERQRQLQMLMAHMPNQSNFN